MMRFKYFSAVCALALPAIASAAWQTILAEPGKRVEIDQASIKKVEGGKTTALGRIILEKPINDPKTSSSYRIIEALNRYDCNARTVSTIRRAYYRGEGEPLREEEVRAPLEMPVHSGTLDDKLLREACRPRAGGESMAAAGKTAEKVSAAAGELRKANEALIQKDVKRAVAQMQPSAPARPEAVDTHPLILPASVSTPALPQRAAPAVTPHPPGAARAHAKAHWSYEGAGGPENWGKLSRSNVACSSGKRQSPIDIRDGIRVDLEPIQFAYRPSNFRVVDNGHTIQVSLAGGGGINLLGKSYQLVQFHFHRPAEERINGKRFDMVAHLVHKADDGKLAVVAVLLEQGSENPLVQTVWNNLPLEKNEEVMPSMMLDLGWLLPDNRSYYTYMGSLTTPPCSEGVLWLVLKQPQQISAEQMQIFSRLYRNNARPVQPAASRLIKESR